MKECTLYSIDTLGYSLRTVVYPPKGRSDCVANHRRSQNMYPIHSNSPMHSVRNHNYRHSSRQNHQGSLDVSFGHLALEFLKRKPKQKQPFQLKANHSLANRCMGHIYVFEHISILNPFPTT